jgi:lipopolysaccharide export system permease protein
LKTLRRLIYGEVLASVSFVTLGFLALFFFFDFVDELQWVGKNGQSGYQVTHALLYVVLMVPSHLYELLPITVLIGTIFVMARFAQSSEFTILRTSGMGPGRALKTLLVLGGLFAAFTFSMGDYLAPMSDRNAQLLKTRYLGRITVGQTGAWLKERQTYHSYAVNVGALGSEGELKALRIFEFNNQGLLVSITQSERARVTGDDAWHLEQVHRSEFDLHGKDQSGLVKSQLPTLRWPTSITQEMVSVALLKPDRMRTLDLFQYIQHLNANGQTAQRYEIEFWKKVFYPLSCLVMVVLALPFAYLHFRSGGIASYVFAGVMIGISFFLLNNVFGYIGTLQNWRPWLAAAAPGMIYSVFSLAAFGWLVLKR